MIEGSEDFGYTLTCDYCGEMCDENFNEFTEAVEYKKEYGWKSVKDKNDDWQELCPECSTPEIINELRGVELDVIARRKTDEEAKRLARLASNLP